MRRTAQVFLHDMSAAIDGIQDAIIDLDFERFSKSWVHRRAVERGLEIISEASRHVAPETNAKYPDIPWRAVAAIGNRLRHEYFQVDPKIVWDITTIELASLSRAVADALKDFEEPT